ncbi:GSTA1 transferase, partial [Dicaeum eximium]|nr:GSTA1 transferase [Dicaeum eximium]
DGVLLFQQVPMVEMDGMKLVQTRAICNYISMKYNLYGKDLKERALSPNVHVSIFVLFQTRDTTASALTSSLSLCQGHKSSSANAPLPYMLSKTITVLKDHGKDFLVGNQLSRADIQLLEVILMAEECKPDILAKFPLLQSFKARISNIPTIKKFLQPGSQRKHLVREEEVPKIMQIFY